MHTLLNSAWLSDGKPVSTAQSAAGHDLSASCPHKQLQQPVKAGLLESVRGVRGGFQLTHFESVSLPDVVLAVEGDEPLVHCTEIRRCDSIGERCPDSTFTRPCSMKVAMGRAEAARRNVPAEQSFADIQAATDTRTPAMTGRVRQALGRD